MYFMEDMEKVLGKVMSEHQVEPEEEWDGSAGHKKSHEGINLCLQMLSESCTLHTCCSTLAISVNRTLHLSSKPRQISKVGSGGSSVRFWALASQLGMPLHAVSKEEI